MGNTGIDCTVTETLTFGSKVENIGYKHSGDTLLIVKDIFRTVNPRNSLTGSGLDFTDRNRETVDQQNDIKTLAAFNLRIYPLVGNYVAVFSHFFFRAHTEICNRNKAMILAKRERILLKNLILKFLVDCDEISRLCLHKQRSQFDDNFICIRRICGNFRIQTNQGVTNHRFHHYIRIVSRQFFSGNILPAVFHQGIDYHFFNYVFSEHCFSS